MGERKEPIDFCDFCQNTGTVDCLCGGDLCICGAEEVPCPRCTVKHEPQANAPRTKEEGDAEV